MPADFKRVKDIFLAAAEQTSPPEREAYLRQACGNDDALRRRVDVLLHRHDQAHSILERPAFHSAAMLAPQSAGTDDDPAPQQEAAGTRLGPYKLLQKIGEGGMGAVWMAEQQEPVRRLVALKVIRVGVDSGQVVARFEAERQALALMDHPNIAKILDGGTTADGRPYFVMELVKGTPITKYCDEHRLAPRQRLELFVPVCRALQHAHQKGIIHRDVKPSNVLVAPYDGRPVVKVIDFGVAKAAGQQLTDKTLFTEFGTVVGTLEYMSPEQAELNNQDIDTRSDVYSLGVLLYELLTGTTPLTAERSKKSAFLELLRAIREEEPPRPSTRLSDSKVSLPAISAQRQTEPSKLRKLLRGELDWIVMKALEKDRNRRYETASGFASDVQCYLADQPVSAGPPTTGYRFRKFARRNRRGLILAGVIGCAVLLTVSAVGWTLLDRSAREGEAQRDEATRRARVGGQLQLIQDEVARLERDQRWPEALDAARRASDLLAGGDVEAEIAGRVNDTIRELELVRLVEDVRANTIEWKGRSFNYRETAERYAAAFRDGDIDLDRLTVEEAAQRLRSRPAVVAALVPVLHHWAGCRQRTGDKAGAVHLCKVAELVEPDPWRQKVWQATLKADHQAVLTLAAAPDLGRQSAVTFTYLADYLRTAGRADVAVGVLLVAQRQHPADFWVHYDLGFTLETRGPSALEQAAGCYRSAVALRPRNALAWQNLAGVLSDQKKLAEAVACYQKAIELDPKDAVAQSNLGLVLQQQGKPDEAIACHRQAIEIDPKFARAHLGLGSALRDQKRLPEALAAFHEAIELDPKRAEGYRGCGVVLRDQHRLPEAVAAFRKAIELDPKFALTYGDLGIALHAQKNLPEAVAAFRKAIDLDPQFVFAYGSLGNVLKDQNDLPGAASCYRKAIELNPKLGAVHYNLGVALQKQGDLPGAIAAYKQALALDSKHPVIQDTYRKAIALKPKYAQALYTEGNVLLTQQKWSAAAALFRQAIELDPNCSSAHRDLGVTHIKQGRVDEAITCFRKSIELDAEDAQANTQLGVALSQKGLRDEAIAAYREAIRVKPDHGDAYNNWAWLLASPADAKVRNPAEAVKLAKKAVELSPERGGWWNTLGVAEYRAGAWKDALAALEKSMELRQGGDANDWFFVAMAQWRLDKKDEARKWYDRAVRWVENNAPQSVELHRFRAEAAELGIKSHGGSE